MKYKYENSSIFTSYIKELLHNTNLPMIPVATDNTKLYEGRSYIKNNGIYKVINSLMSRIGDYSPGKELINLTENFTINSSTYDNNTHIWLGNYLRFIRDYYNVNLMGLYNCFYPSSINTELDLTDYISIDTEDTKFNYYEVPVRLNQIYTIAIDSNTRYEICCTYYDNKYVETPKSLLEQSYKVISGSRFSMPFLYSTYFSGDSIWEKEDILKLIIKLPKTITSSIVILEGNYKECSNVVDGVLVNSFIYNNEVLPDNYVTKSSLLSVNNGISYPFSDRLVEYLLGNVISPLDDIGDNIRRCKQSIYNEGIVGINGIWDDRLRSEIYKRSLEKDLLKGKNNRYSNIIRSGEGSESISEKKILRFRDSTYDLMYYCDKDVESFVGVE